MVLILAFYQIPYIADKLFSRSGLHPTDILIYNLLNIISLPSGIMTIAPSDEIREEIKYTYAEIESTSKESVVSAIDKVKERPVLNTQIRMELPAVPIIGPALRIVVPIAQRLNGLLWHNKERHEILL
jgi:hypothetical protein